MNLLEKIFLGYNQLDQIASQNTTVICLSLVFISLITATYVAIDSHREYKKQQEFYNIVKFLKEVMEKK